jgi:hypothetical protein
METNVNPPSFLGKWVNLTNQCTSTVTSVATPREIWIMSKDMRSYYSAKRWGSGATEVEAMIHPWKIPERAEVLTDLITCNER